MTEYPAEAFRVDGDPSAIRASALGWTEFAEQAGAAASQIRGLDTSLFIGPEADQYRDGLSAKLPPHLQATSEAYRGVASALNIFAASLDDVLERMNPLGIRAPGLWADLTAAERAVESAKSTGPGPPAAPGVGAGPAGARRGAAGRLLPTRHRHRRGRTHRRPTRLEPGLDHRPRTQSGPRRCDRCVRESDQRPGPHPVHPEPNSGWSGFVDGVKGFVKDHVAALSKLSSVLKTVSMVAGFLAPVPGLDIIAAPIALAAGGAALAIDAATMWATGNWDAKSLALDAVAIIPAGKVLSGAGKLAGSALEGTELATKLSRATSRVSDAIANGTQTVRAAAAGAKAYGKSLAADVQEAIPVLAVAPEGFLRLIGSGKTAGQMFADASKAARGAGGRIRGTRSIEYKPAAQDPNWGLTPTHVEKHLFGPGRYSLSQIDSAGNAELWINYIQDLAGREATSLLKNGVEDIIGIFPLADGSGSFLLGIRIAPNAKGSYDLITLLTRQ